MTTLPSVPQAAKTDSFSFDNFPFTAITANNEFWFLAKEVCDILEYTNVSKAISDNVRTRHVLRAEKGTELFDLIYANNYQTPLHKSANQFLLINESGLYSLILRSKMPKAEAFQDWITDEVIPSLRKTGRYSLTAQLTPAQLAQLAEMLPLLPRLIESTRELQIQNKELRSLVLESMDNTQRNAANQEQSMERLAQAISGHPLLVGRNAGEKTSVIHGLTRNLIANGSFDHFSCDSRDDADIARDIRDVILDLGERLIPSERKDWSKNDLLELSYVMKYYKRRLNKLETAALNALY